jgi:hypothetical protein
MAAHERIEIQRTPAGGTTMAARGARALFAVLVLAAAVHAQEPGELLYEFPPPGVDVAGAPGTGLRHTTQNVSSTAFADQIIDTSRLRSALQLPGISSGPGGSAGASASGIAGIAGAGASGGAAGGGGLTLPGPTAPGVPGVPGVPGPLGFGVSSNLQLNVGAGASGVSIGAGGNAGAGATAPGAGASIGAGVGVGATVQP